MHHLNLKGNVKNDMASSLKMPGEHEVWPSIHKLFKQLKPKKQRRRKICCLKENITMAKTDRTPKWKKGTCQWTSIN